MTAQMFVSRGKNVFLASDRGEEIDHIPTGTYNIEYNPMAGGFFLSKTDNMELPKKLYGTALPRADQILNTFLSRAERTTGVLLSGNKGAGKTLLAKTLAAKALEKDIVILVMQQPHAGPELENFLNSISQPVVVFIDEFEKKYAELENQNQLLSLLSDGLGSKLYVMTSNSASVSEFLLNRPSRIFYHFKYKKLEEEVLLGYCADNLQNPNRLKAIQALWSLSVDMSFDILQSIVEESNRYPDKKLLQVIADMNVSLDGSMVRRYSLKRVMMNGERCPISENQSSTVHLLVFQEGDMQVSATVQLPAAKQFEIISKMKSDEYYCYNDNELDLFKAGESFDESDCTNEFIMRLRYSEGTTFLNTERLTFVRQWGDDNFEFLFEGGKADQTMSALEKLFVGLED